MSTYQDTNPISPDALVLGYQVRDHHLPDRPPLARTDTYAQALRAVEQLHQAYRTSLAANGEGTAGLSQSLMVLAAPPPAPSCVTCPLPAARPADELQAGGSAAQEQARSCGARRSAGGHAEPVPVADGTERS